MIRRKSLKTVFLDTLPVMTGYLFLGAGFGVLLHIWKRNTLLSIGGGTLCYMLLVQFIFV